MTTTEEYKKFYELIAKAGDNTGMSINEFITGLAEIYSLSCIQAGLPKNAAIDIVGQCYNFHNGPQSH